ncbi:hypothetical protein [Nostoc sp. FACHB-888]|uniref:hypothetical protein n=1 Tax=Nostoc sp. FACHB-888 TaxID=2692842 RepID=UPI002410EC0E|nr:hypothetical protein [Nostoc sp. FACHB-888]
MTKRPSSRRKKDIPASSSDNTPPASSAEDIFEPENPVLATITVTAVEIPELTEQEQRDKPDGMATLTAFT